MTPVPCIWTDTGNGHCKNDADFFGSTAGAYYAICEAHANEWGTRDRTPVKRITFDQPMPSNAIIYCPQCSTQIASDIERHLRACELTFLVVTDEEIAETTFNLLRLVESFNAPS